MIGEQLFSKASGPTAKLKNGMRLTEAHMRDQSRAGSVLAESLPVLAGPESIVELLACW